MRKKSKRILLSAQQRITSSLSTHSSKSLSYHTATSKLKNGPCAVRWTLMWTSSSTSRTLKDKSQLLFLSTLLSQQTYLLWGSHRPRRIILRYWGKEHQALQSKMIQRSMKTMGIRLYSRNSLSSQKALHLMRMKMSTWPKNSCKSETKLGKLRAVKTRKSMIQRLRKTERLNTLFIKG